ncbi:thiamine monophosphate kinase [Bradyrhizobium sp. USDA 3240]
MQPVEQIGRQAAGHLNRVGGGRNRLPDRLRAGDHVAITGKIGRSHAHVSLPQARRMVAEAATSAVALSSLSICSIDLPRVSSPKNR